MEISMEISGFYGYFRPCFQLREITTGTPHNEYKSQVDLQVPNDPHLKSLEDKIEQDKVTLVYQKLQMNLSNSNMSYKISNSVFTSLKRSSNSVICSSMT